MQLKPGWFKICLFGFNFAVEKDKEELYLLQNVLVVRNRLMAVSSNGQGACFTR